MLTAASRLEVRLMLALAVVVIVAHAVGWAAGKVGQPRVNGEILAGILLGPSLLGLVAPSATEYLFPTEVIGGLKVLAQIGLVLFMFIIGVELDLDRLRNQGRKAVAISHASIVLPISLGVLLGVMLYPRLGDGADRLGFVLFMGVAMSVTAFPVLARILQETNLTNTDVGVLAIACAAVDDVTAWCVLAVVVAVLGSNGIDDVVMTIGLSIAFVALTVGVIRPRLRKLDAVPLWAAVAIALVSAWLTEVIGIHAIFGAFLAGSIMPRGPRFEWVVIEKLETFTVSVLLPVFFAVVGLSTRIDALDTFELWAITALVVVVAVAGKWGGSMLAARLSGESWRTASLIGVLLNTRGLTELVILTVGLELGAISVTVFTIMVLMALITTLMTTPLIRMISGRRVTLTRQVFPTSRPASADEGEIRSVRTPDPLPDQQF